MFNKSVIIVIVIVGQIKVKLDQFGSKAHSTLKIAQNEENRLTSVIYETKITQNTISIVLVRGQVMQIYRSNGLKNVKLGGLIMIA